MRKWVEMQRETAIQIALCVYVSLKYPKALYTSDLGGVRLTMNQAKKAAKMRKKKGHPDWTLYEPKGGFVGLMIELKSETAPLYKADGTLRKSQHLEEQAQYGKDLEERGWCFSFARGLDEAIRLVDNYMKG